jgi:uncharacterized protein
MILKCPRCGKEMDSAGNPYRPFCGERCKMIDLGNWAMETYRLPGTDAADDETEASKSPKDSGEE